MSGRGRVGFLKPQEDGRATRRTDLTFSHSGFVQTLYPKPLSHSLIILAVKQALCTTPTLGKHWMRTELVFQWPKQETNFSTC